MKPFIHTIIALILPSAAAFAAEAPDTTITAAEHTVVLGMPDGTVAVEVTDTTGATVTTLVDNSSNHTIHAGRSISILNINIGHNGPWDVTCGGFAIGWTAAPGHPASMPVEMGKSWEIGWTEIVGVSCRVSPTTRLRLGFGLDWRNYKITTPDYRFTLDADGNVVGAPYPAGTSPRNSRLKVFNLQLPLTVKQRMPFRLFGQRQWAAVGVTLNYASHASMLTRYTDADGTKVKISNNKIGHRRWSYELQAILGLSADVGLYLRYQPLSVLRGPRQPDFRSLSTGLILFY